MKTSILVAAIALLGACHKSADDSAGAKKGKGGAGRKLEYPVDVATLESRQVQYTVNATGTVEAFQTVQITARVAGAVDKVNFTEGEDVKADQVLAVIESARYQIAVSQADALYRKAQATQKSAEAALNRRLTAEQASPGLVPGEEIEQKRTAVDTAKADVEQSLQTLKVAQLNLRDSSVRAPIAGIVQTRTVQQGQYLPAGYVLATILQRDPLMLRFQVTETDAPRLKNDMPVTLTIKGADKSYAARIKLVAGSADPATRLVPVLAQLDPTDHNYWLRPGAFSTVNVPIGEARPGIVVPSLAVSPSEKGNIVWIVDDKNQAHERVVSLGMRTPDGGVELRTGVKIGEVMVIRGIEPLSDGAPVSVKSKVSLEQAAKDAAAEAAKQTPTEGTAAIGAAVGSGSDVGAGSGSASK
ncbi:MAG TPA: efflux RND transporter periplasmic adaptor subunit [Kofleriaceae bacterium]|jgi:RND family efflux transporter MFP subunit